MKQWKQWLVVAGVAGATALCATQALAQDNTGGTGGGGAGGGRGGRGNFDPAQFRERMMERVRETLEVKDDTEWKAIQPLVQKVMDARMASMSGMGRGMMMMGRGRPPGDDNGGGGGNGGGNGGGRGGRGFMGQEPSPEAEALQKAIDAKASNSEMKAALAKYAEYRKSKQAELEKAQSELRKVLSLRQEAIATANGML